MANQVTNNIKWIAIILALGFFGMIAIMLLSFAITIPLVVKYTLYIALLGSMGGFLVLLLARGVWRK